MLFETCILVLCNSANSRSNFILFTIFMPPASKKLVGYIACFGLVRSFVRPLVTFL